MSPVAASVPTLSPPSVVRTVTAAPTAWVPYPVRPGDTLYDIAARTGTSVAALVERNHLSGGGHLIRAGSSLLVPASTTSTTSTTSKGSTAHTGAAGTVTTSGYRVVAGDTIEAIARRTGASQRSLISANGLRAPYLIQIGQVLTVSRPVPTHANSFAGRTYPESTVSAASRARAAIAAAGTPSRTQMRAIITATAARYGVDRRLALAVAYQESGWDQGQVSVANAIGAMQVIPSSGQWASGLAGRRLDLLTARDNATAGVVILKALTRSSSSLEESIAGYYQGLGSVRQNGMYADTRAYVASVKALMARV